MAFYLKPWWLMNHEHLGYPIVKQNTLGIVVRSSRMYRIALVGPNFCAGKTRDGFDVDNLSQNWMTGKLEPETPRFDGKNPGFRLRFSPTNQSIESSEVCLVHGILLFFSQGWNGVAPLDQLQQAECISSLFRRCPWKIYWQLLVSSQHPCVWLQTPDSLLNGILW